MVSGLHYFVTQGSMLFDQSVLQPLRDNIISPLAATFNFTVYNGSVFSYQNTFRLYFAGTLDDDDATVVLDTIKSAWQSYFGEFIS
jgi:hypothetical protein